ncbi:MAG: type I-E CRISPR-associated endonuclease Cas1e [Candidatus Acetothermia bacterium]|jgi:CRISPR-associated protein Cas1|nr:type I-E CRISPR-associated endonuclease Cas1e [Candidatus Acetothermia bacterium]
MATSGKSLRELPQFSDGLSFLYLERAVVEQTHGSVTAFRKDDVVAIPAAAVGVLMLGPGTTITHAAVKTLTDHGCCIMWLGEDGSRFYASGLGETRNSLRLMQQAQAWADPRAHMEVVMRLYRFRFSTPLPEGLSLRQVRGLEGVRVRDTYARWSRETGVSWSGRRYDRGSWGTADAVNRAVSSASSVLYGICHAAIVSLGYSPGLGFIHTGRMLSFVYDIADLYKADLAIPVAFRTVAQGTAGVEGRVRRAVRDRAKEIRLLERVVTDLLRLFDGLGGETDGGVVEQGLFSDDGARPGELWDPDSSVQGGVNYGGDGVGEGSPVSEGGTEPVADRDSDRGVCGEGERTGA